MVVANKKMAETYGSAVPVRTPTQKNKGVQKLLCIVSVLLVGLITFIFLYRTTQIYLLKSDIFQLEKQLATVNEEYNMVSLQVSRKKNPDNIIPVAKEQCGLILPNEDQFIPINTRH